MSEIRLLELEPVGKVTSSTILEANGFEDTRIPEVDFQKNDLPIGALLSTSEQVEQCSKTFAVQSLERLKSEILSHLEQIFPYDHYDHGKIFAYEDVVGMINEDIKELE